MSDSTEVKESLREMAEACRIIAENVEAGHNLSEPEFRRALEEFYGALGALLGHAPPSHENGST